LRLDVDDDVESFIGHLSIPHALERGDVTFLIALHIRAWIGRVLAAKCAQQFLDQLAHTALLGERRGDGRAQNAQLGQPLARAHSFFGAEDELTLLDGKFGYFTRELA
jgi:hypothetical protein